VALLLVGLPLQALHFGAELLAGFHRRLPLLLSLLPRSTRFFVAFNVLCLAISFGSASMALVRRADFAQARSGGNPSMVCRANSVFDWTCIYVGR
jgi:hypothetical protein